MTSKVQVPTDARYVVTLRFTGVCVLAAVHQLDVQSRSQLVRFCEEDSRSLEKAYRYLSVLRTGT